MSDPTPSASGRPSPSVPRPSALLSLSLAPSASFRLSLSFSSAPLYRFISHRTPNPLSPFLPTSAPSFSLAPLSFSALLALPGSHSSPRLRPFCGVARVRLTDRRLAAGRSGTKPLSIDRSIARSPPIHRRPLFSFRFAPKFARPSSRLVTSAVAFN